MDEIIKNKNIYIQYNTDVFNKFSSKLFNTDYISKEGLIKSEINGRGKTPEIEFEGRRLFLKHYIRGGFAAKISYDKYFFDSIASTRSVKEYNFLNNLFSKELPVPKPAALQVIINKFTYTADLITCKIENVGTLHDFIMNSKMNSNLWGALESTLEKFYNENVYHSDLNSKNVLIDKNNNFHLVDFDNSYFFYEKKLFLKSIMRLERSLFKLDNYKNEMKKIIKKFS
jgi:3-deoxy-D-manno-octulosonic acid kinase